MQKDVNNNWDISKLNEYIWNALNESFNYYMKQFVNQNMDLNSEGSRISEDPSAIEDLPEIDSSSDMPTPEVDDLIPDEPSEIYIPPHNFSDSTSSDEITEPELPLPVSKSQSVSKHVGVQPDVMETHSMIIIKIRLPEGMRESDLRLSINDSYIAIKWTSSYMEQFVPLPQNVSVDEASASIHDSILEIKVPKMKRGETREIGIQKL